MWDTATGQAPPHAPAHGGLVLGVAFSPDGRRSPRPARTRSCASGTRRPAGSCSASADTPGCAGAWRSARTACAWPRPARTGPSASGTRRRSGAASARKPLTFARTPRRSLERGGQPRRAGGRLGRLRARPPLVWDARDRTGERRVRRPRGRRLLRRLAARRPADRLRRLGRRAVHGQGLGRARPDAEVFTLPGRRAGRSSSPWRSAPTADTWSRGGRTGPCKSGTRTTAGEVGTLGTHDRAGPGGGVQPRRPAPGFGERRRGGQTVGRDPPRREAGAASRSARFARHSPGVGLNVAFSPDGKRLATGGKGNTVKIWDVRDRRGAADPPGAQRRRLHRGLQPRRPVGRLGGRGQHREGLGQPHRRSWSAASAATPASSAAWRSARTAGSWSREAATARSRSGT